MGVKVREKAGKLYLDVYCNGRRTWEATGLSISPDPAMAREARRMAEIIRAKREMQLVSEAWSILDPVAGKQTLVGYAEKLAEGRDKADSLPKALPYLREYAGAIRLAAIDERWLEGFKAFLLEKKGLGQSTARNYFRACTFVLRKAEQNRMIPRNPAVAVKGPGTRQSKKVYLVAEELEALAASPLKGKVGYELCRGFFFATYTGLRVSDIKGLKWGDIERTPQPSILKRQKKTGEIVSIPINGAAWAIINDSAIHDQGEYVFPLLAETKSSSSDNFRKWRELAKITKEIGWHTARHSFAVMSLEAGASLYTVSRLLGHTKIATTEVYADLTDSKKRKAVDALPEVNIAKRPRKLS